MKIINDTVPSYNEQEPEQMSLEDVKNMYFTDYAGNYTQTDAIVAGVRSTGMQLEKVAKVGLPQAVGSYVSGLAEPVADVMTKVARPLAAVYPDGGKILDGSLKMEIADKIKERGKVLIETANRNLQVINEEYTKNNPHLAELQSKVGFDIGAQGSQYGAMLLSGAFSPLLSGAVMGGMVYTGEAEESIEKYKKEHGGSLEGYEKQASQDLFWDAANSYVQGVIETKFGAGAQVRAFKGVKDILKNFVRGYTQEFGEEASQDAVDFAFDKFRGRLAEDETLLSRFYDNLRGYVVAGLFGGSTGMAFATYNRYKGIETAEKMVDGAVPEEQKRVVAEAIYNKEAKTLEDVVTVALATSSSLSAKRGDVYNNVVDAVLKSVNNSRKQGGYASIRTDEEAIEYAKAEANAFADRVTKEALLRNKDITQVFDANKVAYEKGKIVLPMTEGLRQVEKTKIDKAIKEKKPSVIQFIRSKGGVIDEGGELKSRDASKQVIGLVNKSGKSLDSIGEALWEEGYFLERPTVAQVLDYIDDELKGIKHYPVGYVEEQAKSRKQTEEMIDEYIRDYSDAMGYDLKNMSYNEKVEVYEQMNRNLNAQGIPTFEELSEEQQERVSILMENGLSEEEAIYMLGLPEYMQEAYTLAQENERLDDIYPAYEGETITINGQEKTVYNSNGDRIAKSKEALENFYRWFGDSKVVDEQGRPLVVYHGTDKAGFNIFDKGKQGSNTGNVDEGFFFGDRNIARTYTKNYADVREEDTELDEYDEQPEFSGMYNVYLKIEEPEIWDFQGASWDGFAYGKYAIYDENEYMWLDEDNKYKLFDSYEDAKNYLEEKGYSYRDGDSIEDRGKEADYTIKKDPQLFDSTRELASEAKGNGLDGVVFENINDTGKYGYGGEEGNVYVAFESNQIKSISNRGTYSESDNIYYQTDNKIYSVFDLKVGDRLKAFGKVEEIDNKERKIKIGGEWYSMFMIDSEAQRGGLTLGEQESTDIDEDIDNYEVKVAKGDRTAVEEQKSKNSEYNKLAKEYYGTTNKLSETGYILTDGSLLDFSGKKFGGSPDNRSIDHREIVDALDKAGMEEFINSGNIRYLPEGDKILLSNEPTPQQYKVIERIINNNGGNITVELMNDANKWGMNRNDYYGEYNDTTFNKVKRDIKAFYTGEGVREITTFFQSAFAGSRVDYDRPSLEAIGSGEGNQAHGWGLYYALNKDIAESYREKFLGYDNLTAKNKNKIKEIINSKGKDYYSKRLDDLGDLLEKNRELNIKINELSDEIENIEYENFVSKNGEPESYTFDFKPNKDLYKTKQVENLETKQNKLRDENKTIKDSIDKIRNDFDELSDLTFNLLNNKEEISWMKEIIDNVDNDGQVHEVDIPENPYLLDEQKTFAEQSDFVKERVIEALKEEITDKKQQAKLEKSIANMDGGAIYNWIVRKLGSKKAASQLLEKYGIKGITYFGRQDGRCFVIFNPADVKVIQKFYQRKNASISFFPDKALIDLTETADAHSLPHEFEHYWLENTFLYTKTSQASPEYKKTFQAVADYLGITEDQEKIEEWQHEKFARSYEEYLRTAKAPNPKVKAAFDDYTKWLRNVYRRLKSKPRYRGKDGKLVVPRLTPAIIDYFNNMFGYIPNQEMAEVMTVTPEIEKAAVKVAQDFEKVIEPTKEVKSEVKEEAKAEKKEEPQKKISRYAERTVGMQVEYEGITIADQLEKAQEFVKNNPQKAEEIVKGGQAPDGLTRNAVLLAYIDHMKSKGKAKEASDAIVELSLSGTKQGQEISMLRVANNNPTEFDYWINKVVDVRRKNNIAKHFRTEAKAEEYIKETAKAIYEEMKGKTGKERAKIAEKWQKIVAEKGFTLYQMDDETYNSIDKIENKLNKALDGEQITEEQADKLFEMTNDLRNSFEETQSENGNPSIETLKKLKEINDYSNSLNPTAQGIIFSSLYGRSVMLMSIKSPVLNIISNIETFTAEKASRYAINVYNGLSNDNLVDKKKINDYREWSKQVYNETGIMSSVVDNLFDEAKVLGETRDSSQGKGKFRALSRFVEDIAFQKLMGAPDNYWKDITFVDVAGNKATQKAYEEGLKGEEARKRANELFDDAILYTPQTEEGQEIRKSAMIATHEATFTQDSSVSKFSLKIREALNMISGRHFRLGEMILPFVKTPANVQMLGIEASVGFLYTAYHIKDIVTNPKSTVSQRAIQAGFRNGVGIILAILVASSFDDDEDYIPEYDNASPKQRDIARLKNAPFNSVKIGGKYISLDYFGPLGVPLAGILKARKSDNKVWEYLKGVVGQGMKVPGVKEIQALTGDISRAIEYKKTSDQVAKDVMEWAGEQAYSRAVPSFVSDVAKFIDTYERETGGEFSNRIKAKIPVLREELPIKTDISGRRVEGEGITGILFGARVKTANESKIVKEISRLNKSGNAPTLSDPTRYGVFRELIPELKNKIRSEFNLEYGKRVSELISSSQYQKMDDSDKQKQLNKIRKDITGKLKKTYGLDKRK